MCIFAVGLASVPTQEKTPICAFVERTYLIIVSREGNHARSELLSKIFESFNVMGCIPLSACLWACKERFNLCMNRASLDRESNVYHELAQTIKDSQFFLFPKISIILSIDT